MKRTLNLTLLLLISFSSAVCHSFDYTKGLSDIPYSFIASDQLPTVGKSYKDPVFGTDITRITNVKKGNPSTKAKGIVNEYARADLLNADGSLGVFHGTNATWYLYDMNTLKYKGKILGQGRLEPRWHATDPNILFFIKGKSFYKYNVKKKNKTLLYDVKKDYPDASWITTQGEGDGSADSRYWSFMVVNYSNQTKKKTYLDWITFDAETKTIISRNSNVPGNVISNANTVSMSMTGEYILVESTPTQVFNRDWTNGRALPGRHGHGDLALSKDGRDVFVAQDTSNDHITMIYLDTLEEVKVMYIPFQAPEKGGVSYQGFHISGNSTRTPGWVLMSTYGRSDQPTYWSDGSLFLLELKENGRHFRVVHTNARTSKGGKDYWSEAFATIDRQGKYVFWGSNWGITGEGYSDVYRVTLPENWFDKLSK
ncbi:MAG: hypothetical protein AB8D52_08950 [Gammaproteobacteria bacterium]